MATTTNYGWTTPDDTALVKDGAAAIRTLGSSVDTTTKALNPETTLGDLAYRSSTANVKTRLGLGTAGQVLTVNSGATAPEWATSSSGGMTLISTTTLTGASVTLSSIPQTYNDLQLVIQNFRPSTDSALRMRINADTGVRYIADLGTQDNLSFGDSSMAICPNQQESSVASQFFSVTEIPNYTNATTWKIAFRYGLGNGNTTSTSATGAFGTTAYNQTGAITSLVLFPEGGTFTSGTALLYGVK